MSSQPATTKEPLAEGLSTEDIQRLIDQKKAAGATGCEVVREGTQRFLVCKWPAL